MSDRKYLKLLNLSRLKNPFVRREYHDGKYFYYLIAEWEGKRCKITHSAFKNIEKDLNLRPKMYNFDIEKQMDLFERIFKKNPITYQIIYIRTKEGLKIISATNGRKEAW